MDAESERIKPKNDDITPERIQEETQYILAEEFSPLVNEDGTTSQYFITRVAYYRRQHGTSNVLTSFYRNSNGEMRLGIFFKPNEDPVDPSLIGVVGGRAIRGQGPPAWH